jgi:hypothetical protein
MRSQRRKRLVVVSAVSFLFSIYLTEDTFAIDLENNVDVSWSRVPGCPNKPEQCKVPVKGAPRLVEEGAAGLKITVSERGYAFHAFKIILKARLFNHSLLDEVPDVFVFDFSGESKAFYEEHEGGILSLSEFEREIGNNFGIFQRELKYVFTVEGIFFAENELPGWIPPEISVSGSGTQIFVDRVGDVDAFHGGDALDTPARSMDVVRALSRIEASPGQNPGAELDVPRRRGADRNRPVGFTHVLDLPTDQRILDAVLTLRVKSDDDLISTDFILLDEGVRSVAAGRPGLPLILFRHLLESSPIRATEYDLCIDLRKVPVVFGEPLPGSSLPEYPDAYLNLLADLRDGELNVLVADDSLVDFSNLEVTFRESDEDALLRHGCL